MRVAKHRRGAEWARPVRFAAEPRPYEGCEAICVCGGERGRGEPCCDYFVGMGEAGMRARGKAKPKSAPLDGKGCGTRQRQKEMER
jgi:hypothetical protein